MLGQVISQTFQTFTLLVPCRSLNWRAINLKDLDLSPGWIFFWMLDMLEQMKTKGGEGLRRKRKNDYHISIFHSCWCSSSWRGGGVSSPKRSALAIWWELGIIVFADNYHPIHRGGSTIWDRGILVGGIEEVLFTLPTQFIIAGGPRSNASHHHHSHCVTTHHHEITKG